MHSLMQSAAGAVSPAALCHTGSRSTCTSTIPYVVHKTCANDLLPCPVTCEKARALRSALGCNLAHTQTRHMIAALQHVGNLTQALGRLPEHHAELLGRVQLELKAQHEVLQ